MNRQSLPPAGAVLRAIVMSVGSASCPSTRVIHGVGGTPGKSMTMLGSHPTTAVGIYPRAYRFARASPHWVDAASLT